MSVRRPPVNVCVVVLGDIGRSPRMQYHVKSLMQHNYNVDLIGYVDTAPLKEITQDPNTKVHKLSPFPDLNLPNILKYAFKTVWQFLTLFVALVSVRRPQYVFIQNPPAIPTLVVCTLYCAITRSKLIIDWHNYTHTILALGSSPHSKIVKLAKWIESSLGRKASANFCVTAAMENDLLNNWNIKATVLYDRPFPHFQPISPAQKHDLFIKLSAKHATFALTTDDNHADDAIESTAFTERFSDGRTVFKAKRPAILVSSTSWTPDEDFSILLRALEKYEAAARENVKYPELHCIITGKGPLKQYYEEIVSTKPWTRVKILMPWLDIEDYPKLLAAADLGVCLHTSSSGLDLPMKVVDMFGCGLPVCAVNFKCLSELVRHEENGFVFENYEELSEQLLSWFAHFPNNISLVNIKETFQKNLRQFQTIRWNDNWNKHALPHFQ